MNTYGLLRNVSHALLALAFGVTSAHAALTDISTDPLNTYSAPSSTDIKPNLMYILDNSGSMGFDYMPDTVDDWDSTAYGRYSAQCNGVYYNPSTTYVAPINSIGTSFSDASFTSAWRDGFKTSSGSDNLSTNFNGEGVAAYYYTYTGTQSAEKQKTYYDSSSTFYKECASKSGNTPGKNVFTKVTVSAAERANFANWYSYYRTRMQMMKTASSLAFRNIDDRFRVGFMTINNPSSGTGFINIDDFTAANKATWYSAFLATAPSGGTPLRAALSKAGQLFAGKISSINGETTISPVQYSCQQNYTILSTDGFWNGAGGTKINGSTAMGNEDGPLIRPYNDGGSATIQTRTSNLQQRTITLKNQTRASTLQTRTFSTSPAPSIQTRTSSNSGRTWTAWSDVASCTFDTSGSSRRDCQYPKSTSSDYGSTWTAWFYASSCSADNSGSSRTQCSGNVSSWSAWSNVGACTVSGTTQCQYTGWTGWGDTASSGTAACTVVPQSTSPNYTVGTAVDCQQVIASSGAWANVSACTTSSTIGCQYSSWSSWSTVASCTALPQSGSSPYTVGTAAECQTLSSGGNSDTLADTAAYYYNTPLRTAALTNCTGPIIAPATTASDLCANDVPSSGRDTATWQHMTTFTVGLGVRGRMVYKTTWKSPDYYWVDSTGDFWDVWHGTTVNIGAGICNWRSSGACTWPTPGADQIENVDDLWHAAVNGHGMYYSAKTPDELTSGLSSLLATVINAPRAGAAAAAASSSPNITSSDNFLFSSAYQSVTWNGELVGQTINITDGTLSGKLWSAQALLDTQVAPTQATPGPTTRKVYTNVSGALTDFLWGNLTAAQKVYFKAPYLTYTSATSGLSQFCSSGSTCLTSTEQSSITAATNGAAGENLVNYLRGDRGNEAAFYRTRSHALGDIVSSQARYVKTPILNFSDAGYAAYKAAKAGRASRVYVGANDGMLHAFDATTGAEAWAYIPSAVLPDLYKLADINYATQHQFFVDGSPEVGDIYAAGSWKTILVGGLNRGGKGYYALDITDPANPTLLWEFADANMGYSYGNPRIVKLGGSSSDAGKWVVLVTSGYSNADGKGHLYVLNANTGAVIRDISTGVGSAASPSGLARISARVVSPDTDSTVEAVYGGDLLGNLWRFDVNGDVGASGYEAQLLVTLKDGSGNVQPITAKPTVATVDGVPVIYIGTGAFLGTTDVSNTRQQSFYAVKDRLGATTYGNPRTAGNNFVQQTMVSDTCSADAATAGACLLGQTIRSISGTGCQDVDWSTNNGWYLDFLTGGERSYTDSDLGLGTLVFTTITPNRSSVSVCGHSSPDTSASFAYHLNYKSGCSVAGAYGVAGLSLGSGLVSQPILAKLPDGTVIEFIRGGQLGDADDPTGATIELHPPIGSASISGRRVSWRELSN